MASYEVSFTIEPPIEATDIEVEDWLNFCLGSRGDISHDNPLHEYDIDGVGRVIVNK